jgi:hypothetical protein
MVASRLLPRKKPAASDHVNPGVRLDKDHSPTDPAIKVLNAKRMCQFITDLSLFACQICGLWI